jgi:hypothetical protein
MATNRYVIKHGDAWMERITVPGQKPNLIHMADGSGMLAVAYDATSGTLLKHGNAQLIELWAADARQRHTDDITSIEVVAFPVHKATIQILNDCIDYSGRVAQIRQELEKAGQQHADLANRRPSPW